MPAGELLAFIKNCVSANRGRHNRGQADDYGREPSESMAYIVPFVRSLERALPDMPARFMTSVSPRSGPQGYDRRGLRQKARARQGSGGPHGRHHNIERLFAKVSIKIYEITYISLQGTRCSVRSRRRWMP